MSELNAKKQMYDRIELFRQEFFKDFGLWLSINCNYFPYFEDDDLVKIYEIVNDHYKRHYFDSRNINDLSREKDLILHRGIYYKIATDRGFRITDICKLSKKNHGTVINALKQINNLLEIKDKKTVNVYNSVLKTIEEYKTKK